MEDIEKVLEPIEVINKADINVIFRRDFRDAGLKKMNLVPSKQIT
jgi:hypothetical protein